MAAVAGALWQRWSSPKPASSQNPYILFGSELSPFYLKVRMALAASGIPFRIMPCIPEVQKLPMGPRSTATEQLLTVVRARLLAYGGLPVSVPADYDSSMDDLGPKGIQVPMLFGPDGSNMFDSTAICHWADSCALRRSDAPPLVPGGSFIVPDDVTEACRFVACLLDEFFDEWGLYLVHHKRWTKAGNTDAMRHIGQEMFSALPKLARSSMEKNFAIRQTTRCGYLFSVAPRGAEPLQPGLPPPSLRETREGFPATHDLLDESFAAILAALQKVLGPEVGAKQKFLFGNSPTIADFSIAGQLGMNALLDMGTRGEMAAVAPSVLAWVDSCLSGCLCATDSSLKLTPDLKPLLAECCRTFVPLMQQNEAAYERYRIKGQREFNEAAFDKREAIYDLEIDSHRCKSVVKTFQVKVWRSLQRRWLSLSHDARALVLELLPPNHGMPDVDFGRKLSKL